MSPSNGRNTHSKRLMAVKGTEPPKACKCPFATISHHPKNPDPETMETPNPPKVTPRFRASKQVQLDTPTPNIPRILRANEFSASENFARYSKRKVVAWLVWLSIWVDSDSLKSLTEMLVSHLKNGWLGDYLPCRKGQLFRGELLLVFGCFLGVYSWFS